MHLKNRLTSITLFSLAVVTLIGCGRRGGDTADGVSTQNRIVMVIKADIQSLNPVTSTDAEANYVQQKIWEPLIFTDPVTFEYSAHLAELPVVSDDHLTYTYTMNPKATWSDGKPVTSGDVIFSFKSTMNPKIINSQQIRGYLVNIDSVFNPGGDASKVEFKLKKGSWNDFNVLGAGYVPIMPKHVWDPKNLTDKMTWADLHNPGTTNPAVQEFATWFESGEIARDVKYQIGSGPYTFQGWVTNDRLILKKNPNYWAKDLKWRHAYPDEIIYKTISDDNAALTALKAQDVDIHHTMTADQYANLDLNQQKYLRKDTVYYNNVSYIAYNSKRPIFKDKLVRKALTALVDRDLIKTQVLKDLVKKAEGPVSPSQSYHKPGIKQIGFNVDTAKKLLAQAGWDDTDGDGFLDKVLDGKRTKLAFNMMVPASNTVGKQVLLIVSEQMRKVGIDASIVTPEWSVYLQETRMQNFDAAYSAIAGNATEDDPHQSWHSSQSKNKGSNFYSFNNPEADRLIEAMRLEFDAAKRKEMSYRLQEITLEEQPMTWMFSTPLRIGMVDRFDNVQFFRQRPCFDPQLFIVRGSGVKPVAASMLP